MNKMKVIIKSVSLKPLNLSLFIEMIMKPEKNGWNTAHDFLTINIISSSSASQIKSLAVCIWPPGYSLPMSALKWSHWMFIIP